MKIGIQRRDYAARRNIVDLVGGIDYFKVYDLCEVVGKIFKMASLAGGPAALDRTDLRATYFDFDLNRADLLHFFNVVSLGKTPWITTFETILPRYQRTLACHHGAQPSYSSLQSDRKIRRALDAMSGPACKRIIAMSECNAKMQREFLRSFPACREAIETKTVVLHPPQATFFPDYGSKGLPDDGPIRFLFVGNSFFRKGGLPMLRAFRQLRKEKYPLTLTIVSSLAIDDYAARETLADVDLARTQIDANREWIVHHASIPNQDVLGLMQASHVGLLPTYADTYGYSVLEFQGCGCPVITTDVRALPEINDAAAGWVIKVPKNDLGEAIYTTEKDRSEIADAIESGIIEIVRGIFHQKTIQSKADAALERIRAKHSPAHFAESLSEIYANAVS